MVKECGIIYGKVWVIDKIKKAFIGTLLLLPTSIKQRRDLPQIVQI